MLAMTDALATLDLSSLPTDVREVLLAQQAIIRTEREAREQESAAHAAMREAQAKLEDQNAELSAYNARLEYLVKEFHQALYAKRSEKLNPDQLDLLFEDLETAIAQTRAEAETRDPLKRREPAQRNIGRLPEHLPQIEHVIAPASTLCPCGCGEMAKIGEDRTKRLDIIPAQFRVIVTVRPKYACRTCETGVVQALAPAHLIEGGLPTEALIAHVLVGKYADHLPLYRQAQIYARSGVDLDRSTLAGWVGKAGFHLAPLVDRLAERLKQSKTLFMDETRAPVLDPGRGRTKTGYLWALTRDERGWSGADPPGVVYFYGDGRSGDFAAEFLDGFTGTLQVDGYAGYKQLTREGRSSGPIVLANCWAHARRKLKEIFDASGSPIAEEGLKRIAEIYRIETDIRGLEPEQRLAMRQQLSAPLVAAFGAWLKEKRSRISAKSRLSEKLSYIHNHWAGLQVFLTDGRVEIDNNPVENRIRPIALGRKNHLFCGHDEGGRSWARIASLIETCKLNGVDPLAYLTATLTAIANGHPRSRLDELLPGPFSRASS
jgi:transposase